MKFRPFTVIAASLATSLSISAAFAQSADEAVLAPVKGFVAAVNAGSLPQAEATMTDAPSITDEFQPFHWQGTGAVDAWMKGDDADAKAHGQTDGALSIAAPLHVTVDADHGYAVVPMTYAYKVNGKTVTESALFTASLVKNGDKWLMSAWTYALK